MRWGVPPRVGRKRLSPLAAKLLLLAIHLCGLGVRGQFDGIPSYGKQEARLVVVGGCVLDALAVYNRACALISETVPFYYVDEDTQSIMVNESKAETNVKWVCWGQAWKNNFPEIDPNGWYSYSVGFGMGKMQTSCGIEFDTYKLFCFGANNPSQDDAGLTVKGQAEPPLGKFKQVDVGGLHACAITFDAKTAVEYDNTLVCWGNNRMGQTKVPVIVQTSALVQITYTFVQLGWEHTCAYRSDHRVVCFGSNLDQAISIPEAVRATKTKDGGNMSPSGAHGCCQDCTQCDCTTQLYAGQGARCRPETKMAVSWYHTCVIRAGCDIQCIDRNAKCITGKFSEWYAADSECSCNSCEEPHKLQCWGYNGYGQTDVPPGQFRHVVADLDFTCAIYAECNGKDVLDVEVPGSGGKTQCELQNTITCWGRNNEKQSQVPKDLCAGAQDARQLAEEILNNTVKATPPPATPRPACVCTPQGCDCLGQYPRLNIEAGVSVRASFWLMIAAGLAHLVLS